MPKRGNFIARFWRGEVPLGISFWVVYILLAIVLGKTVRGVEDALLRGATFDPRVTLLVVAGGLLVGLPIAVWQFVGVWRSAGATLATRAAAGRRAPLAYLARFVVVLGAATLTSNVVVQGQPEMVEYYRMAFLGDPDIPGYGFRAMREGTEAEIVGGFKFGLTRDFEAFAADKPALRIVHLDSLGGRVGEAEHLYQVIRARGLETYVADGCYSACTLAFAAGARRWIGPLGKLGFHASSFPGHKGTGQSDYEKTLYEAAGIAPDFVARALATPSTEIWTPSSSELLQAHVITGLATADTFADSGAGLPLTKARWEARLREEDRQLDALATSRPDLFAPIASASFEAYRAGRSWSAVLRIQADGMEAAFTTMLPGADDATLLELARLVVDETKALQARRPEECYLYGSGKKRELGALRPLFLRREDAFKLRVFSMRAARPEPAKAAIVAATDTYKKLIEAADPAHDGDAVEDDPHTPDGYARYCRVAIMAYAVATQMDPPAAGIMIREILLTK